jgi:hypothetical protein
LLLALTPCVALAESKPKVAVLGVRAEAGVSQGTANLLAEIISTDVTHTGQYEVLTQADVATMIGVERQRQLLGCNQNDNCFAEIGAALGTDLILDASVGTVGTLRVLAMRLYDAKKSRAVARESITVNDESALIDAAHLAVSRVLGTHVPSNTPPVTAATPSSGTGTVPEGVTASKRSFNPGFIALIAGAGIAVVGGIFGVLALTNYNQFKMDPFNDAVGNTAKTFSYVADGMYVGAAVTGVVALILLLVSK